MFPAGYLRTAAVYRFRPTSWRGPVLLLASVVDVLVYAVAITLVMGTVFQLFGFERFATTLLGLISLRWSLSCAIQAVRVAQFVNVCRPVYDRPILATVILAMGPPTFVFVISLLLFIFGLSVMSQLSIDIPHTLGWGLFTILVQFSWNLALVLVIIHVRLRRILVSEVPVIFAFILVLILSPVAYQFSDIPQAASQVLTSLNPASHLIAAYQNSFWYLQDVSLQVLPISLVVCAGIFALLLSISRSEIEPQDGENASLPQHLVWDGYRWHMKADRRDYGNALVFRNWRGELPWVTGSQLLYLLDKNAANPMRHAHTFRSLAPERETSDILESPLPIFSERARERLCIVPALEHAAGDVVLDGAIDSWSESELARFCETVADVRHGRGGLAVVSRNGDVMRALVGYRPRNDAFGDVIPISSRDQGIG